MEETELNPNRIHQHVRLLVERIGAPFGRVVVAAGLFPLLPRGSRAAAACGRLASTHACAVTELMIPVVRPRLALPETPCARLHG